MRRDKPARKISLERERREAAENKMDQREKKMPKLNIYVKDERTPIPISA